MAAIKLSPRLLMIASMVPSCRSLVDVGCDHGLLGLYLLSEGRIQYLLGTDLREGPLSGAERNAREAGLTEKAEFRLSDGLDEVKMGEGDTLVISGMGGQLIASILDKEKEKTRSFSVIVVEPQKDHELARRALAGNGFIITDEKMTVECGKFYPVIRAEKTEGEPKAIPEDVRRMEEAYGPFLLKRKDPVLKEYLLKRRELISTMLEQTRESFDESVLLKRGDFKQEREDIDRILEEYE